MCDYLVTIKASKEILQTKIIITCIANHKIDHINIYHLPHGACVTLVVGASEASPLVSHARGPGSVCMYVHRGPAGRHMDRHTIFAFVTRDPLPIST